MSGGAFVVLWHTGTGRDHQHGSGPFATPEAAGEFVKIMPSGRRG